MAEYTIDKIEYGGNVYKLQDNVSGYITVDTDAKVIQAYSTANAQYPLLMSATAGVTSTDSRGATTAILNNKIYAQPGTGELTVSMLNVTGDQIVITDSSGYNVGLTCALLSTNRAIAFPDKTGTIALTSDIPSIPSNNVTGSGTSGYLAKFNGANTITNGPVLGSSTTTFLRNDGSWETPTDTDTTYTLSGALSSHKFTSTLTAGGSGSGTSTSELSLAEGTGISITDDTTNKKMTIALSSTIPSITLNGSSTTSPSFYAPTSAGTSGQILQSNGSGAPTWANAATNTTWWGTSSTSASTTAKVVTCEGFTLTTGAVISVNFSTANTADAPTLNVNSTGAKSIYVGNSVCSGTANVLKWSANTVLTFMYDGTYWRYISSVSAGSVSPSRGGGNLV